MAFLGGIISELIVDSAAVPDNPLDPSSGSQEKPEIIDLDDYFDDDDEEEEEEEEEMIKSAYMEPSTLPYRDRRPPLDGSDGAWSEKGVSEPEEPDTGISGGSLDLSESDGKSKDKWRESMPEGERWRDHEVQAERDDKGGGGWQADDEDEGDDDEGDGDTWTSDKAAINPHVTIVHPSGKKVPEESEIFIEKYPEKDAQAEPDAAVQYYPEWTQQDDKYYLCDGGCGGKLGLLLSLTAGAALFPLLVWAGYKLLPFDPPLLHSAPLRVVYTLRCSFFAILPVLLGLLVQGVARLRFSDLKPLYRNTLVNREVAVHSHFVNESLALFFFFFLQLTVMATYLDQDMVKLVPLLTIVFVFGRLIYWLCLSLGSSIRGLGFGLSFFPVLVMLGANFYFICASAGRDSIFDVEPPTQTPPRPRFWG